MTQPVQADAHAGSQGVSRLADPGAWAVTAFATTSFMLGMYNAGLINAQGAAIVIPVALFFDGLIQIIVGILEASKSCGEISSVPWFSEHTAHSG